MIIAQISDIHAAPGNDNLARFDRALAWLKHVMPDVLVITGDLIDDGWTGGYRAFAARLKSMPWSTYVLPGNSDERTAMGVLYQGATGASDALHFAADCGEIRLIGLDSTLATTPAGSVAEHLPWLDTALSAPGPATSILFLHHHVFASGIAPLDEIMCLDHQALHDFLLHHPRRPAMIASGHVHRPISGSLAGIPAWICGSLCPVNPAWFGTPNVPPVTDAPSLMLYRYAGGVLTSHLVNV